MQALSNIFRIKAFFVLIRAGTGKGRGKSAHTAQSLAANGGVLHNHATGPDQPVMGIKNIANAGIVCQNPEGVAMAPLGGLGQPDIGRSGCVLTQR